MNNSDSQIDKYKNNLSWVEQENYFKEQVFEKLWKQEPWTLDKLIDWLVKYHAIKNALKKVKIKDTFKKIIMLLPKGTIVGLDRRLELNIIKKDKYPNLDIDKIDEYIIDRKWNYYNG